MPEHTPLIKTHMDSQSTTSQKLYRVFVAFWFVSLAPALSLSVCVVLAIYLSTLHAKRASTEKEKEEEEKRVKN